MEKKALIGVFLIALVFFNAFAYSQIGEKFLPSERKIRVIILPPENKNLNEPEISSISNIKFLKKFRNGIVALVPKNEIEKLRKKGYKVYRDYKFKAFLTESVPLIQANKVWNIVINNTNITGKGVSICVIDTGVDYTHPDLGSCFPKKKGNGTEISYVVESLHPYEIKSDIWYNITYPEFERISLHFVNYSLQFGYDFIEIYDENYTLVATYTGYDYDIWTPVINGSTVRIRLISDDSVNDYGFYIDKISNITTHELDWSTCKKVIYGYDFVNSNFDPADHEGHGTHVAGIIAANGSLKGVAPDVKIIAVKVLDANGEGSSLDVVKGIEWCINHSEEYNISVISMSLGGGSYTTYCDSDFPLLSEVINKSVERGIAVVVATGNEANYSAISSPACIYNAIRVGASDKADSIAWFTNRGGNFDTILMAPGVDINSTIPNGYSTQSGTSMATPHVSGAIALIKQVNPELSPKEIERLLNETGKQIYDIATNRSYPRIDVYKAVSKLIKPQLFDQKVTPLFGNKTTIFNFSVNYTHAANVSPVYVKVCINNSCYNASSNNYDFVHGSIFNFTTNLSYGVYTFFFEAFDGTHFVNTSLVQFPWVADKFWINETEEISYENLTEGYVITNSSKINVTGTLVMKNSYVKNFNKLNISAYGNVSISNTSFEIPPELWIFIINKNVNTTLFGKRIEISGSKISVNISNTSLERILLVIKNSSANITNSNITFLYIGNASVFLENSTISYLQVFENSSVKGYFSIENISFSPEKYFERYFPVKLVRDVNLTPVEGNITLWKNKSISNFTTQNGFAWISALFSQNNESYYLLIEGYGFAKYKGRNITLLADLDTSENITLDVVVPWANVSIFETFISPLSSPGIKDNTTIILNSSEQLESECIFINSSSAKVYQACGSLLTWNASSVEDGVYSLWINLTDFWGNRNITKIGEIIVDNTLPQIELIEVPKVVMNSSKINITVLIHEANLNFSRINVTSSYENFSLQFTNFTSFIFIPNYTANYSIKINSLDKAGNENEKIFYFISRPKKEMNLTLIIQNPVKIAFVYEDSVINQSYISSNTSVFLPDWIYNISISFNNSALELNDVNTTENENMSLRIEQVSQEGFLKVLAFDVKANFSTAFVKINYSDTNYTNEEYLGVYRCDSWNFSLKKCMSSWIKENATLNKSLKIVKVVTTHFSAFALKQEPYCGDGIVNRQDEECDINDFAGKSCESFGYDYGELSCTADCKISTAKCKYFSKTSSGSGEVFFYEKKEITVVKNKTFPVIILKCPENILSFSKNVSFKIIVENKGNKSSSLTLSLKGAVYFEKEFYLRSGESEEFEFTYFFSPGNYSIEANVLNASCKFTVNVTLPEIYYELKGDLEKLKPLIEALNISSKRIDEINKLIENEKYEDARKLLSLLESEINSTISKIKKDVEKETDKGRNLFVFFVFISLLLILIILTTVQRP